MASLRTRRDRSLNVWPGYVDALATLLLAVVFLLTIFVVGQFFLSQEITGRDSVLNRLNRQIADLTDLLAWNAPIGGRRGEGLEPAHDASRHRGRARQAEGTGGRCCEQ